MFWRRKRKWKLMATGPYLTNWAVSIYQCQLTGDVECRQEKDQYARPVSTGWALTILNMSVDEFNKLVEQDLSKQETKREQH